jgi:hypothetical protein
MKQLDAIKYEISNHNFGIALGLIELEMGVKPVIQLYVQLSIVYEGIGNNIIAYNKIKEGLSIFKKNGWLLYRKAELEYLLNRYHLSLATIDSIGNSVDYSLVNKLSKLKFQCLIKLGQKKDAFRTLRSSNIILLENSEERNQKLSKLNNVRIRVNNMITPFSSKKYVDNQSLSYIESIIDNHVKLRNPMSLVRLGDGEGKVLIGKDNSLVGATFSKASKNILSEIELSQLKLLIKDAVLGSSIVGLPREDMKSLGYLEVIDILGADLFKKASNNEVFITDCHIHYSLYESGFIDSLIKSNSFIGFVSGRDLTDYIMQLNKDADVAWHRVPIQNTDGDIELEPHYPIYFERILKEISVPFKGAIYLIAAGVLGKIYSKAIKDKGGIAIDIGAVADLMSGVLDTRPYLKNNFK